MKVLVAGASGALGTPLTRALIAGSHEVLGLARSPESMDHLTRLGVHPILADVMDRDNLLNAVKGVQADAVIHALTALKKTPLRHQDMYATQSLVQFVLFNRHYLGDAGIFQLAVSLGLVFALPDPTRKVSYIWIGAIASLMHTTNHFYDLLFVSTPPLFALWLPQTLTLLILALSLLIVAIRCSWKARAIKRAQAGPALVR
jgi:putative NADH-flavin reductase